MKIKGLSFEEAVRVLAEGKCEKIRPKDRPRTVFHIVDGLVSNYKGDGIHQTPSRFLGEWELVGVKRRAEKRTATYWLIVWNNGMEDIWTIRPEKQDYDRAQHVFEFTKTYTYAYPEEV